MKIAPTGQDVWTLEINDDEEGTSLLAIYASQIAAVEALICEALNDAEGFEIETTREAIEADLTKDDAGNVLGWSRPKAWTGYDWSTMSLDIGRCPLLGEVAQAEPEADDNPCVFCGDNPAEPGTNVCDNGFCKAEAVKEMQS